MDTTPFLDEPERRANSSVELTAFAAQREAKPKLCLRGSVISFAIIAIIALIFFLLWTPTDCDQPLAFWIFIEALLLAHWLLINIVAFWQDSCVWCLKRVYLAWKIVSILLDIGWFVCGNVWYYTSTECDETSPYLYWSVLALLILHYIVFASLCLVLIGSYFLGQLLLSNAG